MLTAICIRFCAPHCKVLKILGGFGISSLPEISKPDLVIVIFNQTIDFLYLYNTTNSF